MSSSAKLWIAELVDVPSSALLSSADIYLNVSLYDRHTQKIGVVDESACGNSARTAVGRSSVAGRSESVHNDNSSRWVGLRSLMDCPAVSCREAREIGDRSHVLTFCDTTRRSWWFVTNITLGDSNGRLGFKHYPLTHRVTRPCPIFIASSQAQTCLVCSRDGKMPARDFLGRKTTGRR
jgi:hypothetical protein